MKKKEQEKYKQIVDIAKKLFLTKGFDGASMSEISRKLGGSKATLYNYFSSKEELINVVMFDYVQEMSTPLYNMLDNNKAPLQKILYDFGVSYLKFMLSKEMIDIRRTIIMSLHQIKNGVEIFKKGPLKQREKITLLIKKNMNNKVLKKGDPWRASVQYISLIECEHIKFAMLGVNKKVSDKEINTTVKFAVDIFLKFYSNN